MIYTMADNFKKGSKVQENGHGRVYVQGLTRGQKTYQVTILHGRSWSTQFTNVIRNALVR